MTISEFLVGLLLRIINHVKGCHVRESQQRANVLLEEVQLRRASVFQIQQGDTSLKAIGSTFTPAQFSGREVTAQFSTKVSSQVGFGSDIRFEQGYDFVVGQSGRNCGTDFRTCDFCCAKMFKPRSIIAGLPLSSVRVAVAIFVGSSRNCAATLLYPGRFNNR